MKKKTAVMVCIFACAAAMLAGCDGGNAPSSRTMYPGSAGGNNGGEPTDAPGGPGTVSGQDGGEVTVQSDGTVRVSNVDGLIRAIEPGAKIVLEPGTYNLSEYLDEIWDHYGQDWNDINGNDYVWIEEVYDGVQLHLNDVDGLSIVGSSSDRADTQIITDPRYATLFTFHSSEDVFLSNLTMGHTNRGDCAGDVLEFQGCTNIRLVNMDLYGCGCYGITASNEGSGKCGNFQIFDSVIRDCAYGPLAVWGNNSGDWVFRNCELTGSDSGGYFEDSRNGKICFYDCVFGDRETEIYRFRDDSVTENCQWGTAQTYPDAMDYWIYEELEGPEFHKDQIKIAPFDEGVLKESMWEGFETEDEDAGTTHQRASWITFYADGTASYFNEGLIVDDLTWECDGHYGAQLFDRNGDEWGGVTIYNDPAIDGLMYMDISTQDGGMWFYR